MTPSEGVEAEADYGTSPAHMRAIAGDIHRTERRYLSDLLCKCADRQAALLSVLSAQREEIERLRKALENIRRTPSMPFPDPVAHSWQAWGSSVFLALRTTHEIARAALADQGRE